MQILSLVALISCWTASTLAIPLSDPTSVDDVCDAAAIVAQGEFNYYMGLRKGGTVGMFSQPYYWWQAGEAFGGLLNFYTFCQSDNDTLRDILIDAMYHQAGEDYNYVPSNQSLTEGNDDQGVWGLTIMDAAERNFTNPSKDHSWISLSQAVYNTMNARWDSKHCGGGLRWQIFTWNSGYDYKNTISNGLLFQMAARLARYLDNETYLDTAERVWKWMGDVGFFHESGDDLVIYDGAKIGDNCSDVTKTRWSYSYGVFMTGCAYIYNYTGESVWKTRAEEIIHVALPYFQIDGYMAEASCAPYDRCNNDQRSFRSLYSRSLAMITVLMPDSEYISEIEDFLQKSAEGAAQSCSGGSDGVTCGEDWHHDGWDDKYGLGEQMCALEVMLANIADQFPGPYSVESGASNDTNSEAGLDTEDYENVNQLSISTKDKAGAGVLTAVVLGTILGGGVWMIF